LIQQPATTRKRRELGGLPNSADDWNRCATIGNGWSTEPARPRRVAAMPEMVIVEKRNTYSASLYDLLTAYAAHARSRHNQCDDRQARGVVLKDARDILTRLIGSLVTGRRSTVSDRIHVRSEERRTAVASSFAATLELVREGKLEMRQDEVLRRSICAGARKASRQSRWHHERTRNASVIPFKVDEEPKRRCRQVGPKSGTEFSPEPRERLHMAEAVRWPRRSFFASASRQRKAASARLPDGINVRGDGDLQQIYARRGVNLVRVAMLGVPHAGDSRS